MSFNAVAAVLDGLKVYPEPMQLPDALVDATPQDLAEGRSRLLQIAQVARELVKLIDAELAVQIPVALRYGDDIYRPSNGRGSAKVRDDEEWWLEVMAGLTLSPNPVGLLAALYPASSVRLTALPKLAAALSQEPEDLKQHHIVYDSSTSPLSVMPIARAPKYLQDLEEGEVR